MPTRFLHRASASPNFLITSCHAQALRWREVQQSIPSSQFVCPASRSTNDNTIVISGRHEKKISCAPNHFDPMPTPSSLMPRNLPAQNQYNPRPKPLQFRQQQPLPASLSFTFLYFSLYVQTLFSYPARRPSNSNAGRVGFGRAICPDYLQERCHSLTVPPVLSHETAPFPKRCHSPRIGIIMKTTIFVLCFLCATAAFGQVGQQRPQQYSFTHYHD